MASMGNVQIMLQALSQAEDIPSWSDAKSVNRIFEQKEKFLLL